MDPAPSSGGSSSETSSSDASSTGTTATVTPLEPESGDADEFVLGRGQMAGLLLVVVTLITVFAAVAYLTGKGSAAKVPIVITAAPRAITSAAPAPVPEHPTAPPRKSVPLFGTPVAGGRYLQTAAVDKGVAVLLTEGLRARGLEAFASPTATPKIFRVLIGPLPDQTAYLRAKDTMDDLDLPSTAHK